MEFDLETPFPNDHRVLPSDTHIHLFNVESDHMPAPTYHRSLIPGAGAFLVDIRRNIMSLVLQLSGRYGAATRYLAVNYADRFLSYHPFPEEKQWFLNLAAVCCVILALKMTKTEFSISEIQQDAGAIFDMQTVERMEKLILGTLSWRMRSVTPFCFLDFFISTFSLKGPPSWQALKARARQIIFKTQTEVELLKFRPSLISAAALLSACDELFPLHFHCFKETTLDTTYVNADDLSLCYSVMQNITRNGYELESEMDNNISAPCSTSSEHSEGAATTLVKNRNWHDRDLKRRRFDQLSFHKCTNDDNDSG